MSTTDLIAQARQNATTDNVAAIQQTPRHMQVRGLVEGYRDRICSELPAGVNPHKFIAGLTTAIQKTPALLECTDASLMSSALMCAGYGMVPNTPQGHCYILPYNEHQRDGSYIKKAQFQLGYQGVVALVYASGEVSVVNAYAVYEGDEFGYAYGLDPKLEHFPCGESDPAKLTHAYAVITMCDGTKTFEVMPRKDIDAIRARSKSADKGPWVSDYAMMARKTVLIRASRYLPKGDLLARAVASEQTQIGESAAESLTGESLPTTPPPSNQLPADSIIITEDAG